MLGYVALEHVLILTSPLRQWEKNTVAPDHRRRRRASSLDVHAQRRDNMFTAVGCWCRWWGCQGLGCGDNIMEQGPCGVQAAWGAVGQVEHAFRYVDNMNSRYVP